MTEILKKNFLKWLNIKNNIKKLLRYLIVAYIKISKLHFNVIFMATYGSYGREKVNNE